MALSVAANAAIVAALAFVLRTPLPKVEPIHARTIQPTAADKRPSNQQRAAASYEPIVRQVVAGALESVTLEPPDDLQLEISDAKSNGGGKGAEGQQKVKTVPSVRIAEASGSLLTRPAAHPATAAGSRAQPTAPTGGEAQPTPQTTAAACPAAASAEGPVPGMAEGSQLPPDLLQAIDTLMQGKFKRRTPGGRGEGVRDGGGTVQSEEAVQRALHWLAIHQRQDGSWNFNHLSDACQHYCTHPGSEASKTAATALALLPFLGAGYTHKAGEFQSVVGHGLEYLKTHGIRISYGNDLRDGSMYGHALATIALCEAFGMTRDDDLQEAAQGGLNYIAYVQDNNTGGWRYNPGEPGDTTVTGWMLMALKSGQMARLNVQSPAIFGAQRFLNSVQNADGSEYGYQSRKPRPATTAVGLLCRMYTGWRRDNPGLVKGIARLSAWGPLKDSLYYDYYATQVLFHWAGPEWDAGTAKCGNAWLPARNAGGHQDGKLVLRKPAERSGRKMIIQPWPR